MIGDGPDPALFLSQHAQPARSGPAVHPARMRPAHPVPCLMILHGLGGTKEMMAGLALLPPPAMRRW